MLSRREVKKRIKEQRPLPDEVLTQYPDLFKGMDIKPVKVARNPKATGHKAGVSPHIDELEFRLRKAWEQYWKYLNKVLRDSSAHQKIQDREAAKWWYNKLGEYQAEWDAVMEEVRREIQSNPSSPSAIKRHVRKHLDEDQREYRKMIQDDEELKKWMEENPKIKQGQYHVRQDSSGRYIDVPRTKWTTETYYERLPNGDISMFQYNYDYGRFTRTRIKRKSASPSTAEENPYSSRSRFKHERIESPSKFDKRSFRTITQPDGTEVTIGCPTGKYDAKRKRCKVGTRAQRVLKPKRPRKK